MPDEDIVTRGDLEQHCKYLHEPITSNFSDVKGWLEKLDKRQDAAKNLLIATMLMVILSALAQMLVTTMVKVGQNESVNNSTDTHYRMHDNKAADNQYTNGRSFVDRREAAD